MGRRGLHGGPYAVGDDDEDGLPQPITLRQARHDRMRQTLEGDSRMRAAAVIASTFGLDPITVLEERRPLARLARLAAHNIVVREQNRR
jgi:hypothetical protein